MMAQAPGNPRSDEGFTIIEVVVAMLLLLLGSLAVLGTVDASTRNNFRVEQSQVVVSQLQSELERIKQMPFDEVALTSLPSASIDQADPAWRVSGGQFAIEQNGTDLRPLVVNGSALAAGGTVAGGALTPAATPFESGDVTGAIRRYVVWVNDPKCPDALCPGSQDLKRVIVAATIDSTAPGGERSYQELHTDLVDPNISPVTDAVPPGDDGDTPGEDDGDSFATFWLTDTPCDQSVRQPLTGDHPTHNTLGTCASGAKSGNTPGAPDLMFTEQPKLDPSLPPDQQPVFDFSTDVEPKTNATQDRGLQVRHPSLPGCVFTPSLLDGAPSQKVHRWLSPPVPPGLELLLDGEATLSLWTRTINAAEHPGKICVFLFARKLNLLGQPVDVAMVNQNITDATWFPHEENSWPRVDWTEVSVPMDFAYAAGSLLPGERLGLAIGVEKSGTAPGEGLEMLYDHPSFDSRLQVKTSSVLPLFD